MTDIITPQAEVRVDEKSAVKASAISKIEKLEQLKEDLKNAREMMNNILLNDTDYSFAKSRAKEAQVEVKDKRKRLLENPEVAQLTEKIKEINQEVKELKGEIGTQLGLFYHLTGQPYIETPDDQTYWLQMGYKKGKRD